MAIQLPQPPVSEKSDSFLWQEWFRQLRLAITQAGGVAWASIDKTGSNLNEIVTRAHNVLQSIQGGTSSEYYHLTSAQHATLSVSTSGTYTPTLTNVTNLSASTAYSCQYIRLGNIVTVSGKVDIDPTAAGLTKLGISLPVASNLANSNECAGTAASSGIAGQSAAILGDTTNDRAQLEYIAVDLTNQPMYFTFTYRII